MKIGYTSEDPRARARNLSRDTSAPCNYEVLMASWFEAHADRAEQLMKTYLAEYRLRPKEQFAVPVSDAIDALLRVENELKGIRWHDIRGVNTSRAGASTSLESEKEVPYLPSVDDNETAITEKNRTELQNEFIKNIEKHLQKDGVLQDKRRRERRNFIYANAGTVNGSDIAIGTGLNKIKSHVWVYAYIEKEETEFIRSLSDRIENLKDSVSFDVTINDTRDNHRIYIETFIPLSSDNGIPYKVVTQTLAQYKYFLRNVADHYDRRAQSGC